MSLQRLILLALTMILISSCQKRPSYIRSPFVEMCFTEDKQIVHACQRTGDMDLPDYYEVPAKRKLSFWTLEENGDLVRDIGVLKVWERVSPYVHPPTPYAWRYKFEGKLQPLPGTLEEDGIRVWITIFLNDDILIEYAWVGEQYLARFELFTKDCAQKEKSSKAKTTIKKE